jgi:LCP family protein required for cell wall assembly
VLSTLAVLFAAIGLAWGLIRYRDITFLSVPGVDAAPPGEPSNWLLVGSDSREGIDPNDPNAAVFLGEEVSGKRTDTIIVARVDPGSQTIDLLSVPRDLWVPLAGTGDNGRINSAFNGDDGEQRLVSTVESVLDIEINNYAEVNFVGFQQVVDAVGGVPIWFDGSVRDPKSGLNVEGAGCKTLRGFEALAFARSRTLEFQEADGSWHTDPTGDLGRTARQQYLLSALADTASAKLDLTDLGTVDRILRVGGQNLTIDDGAGAGDLIGLARTFSSVGSEGIRRHALPVDPFRTSGGADVLGLREAEAAPILDIFRGTAPGQENAPAATETVAVDSFTVDVENGAAVAGIAGDTAAELRAVGFVVDGVGNAPAVVDQTVIRHPGSLAAQANTLAQHLSSPPRFEVDDSLSTVVLVIGPDFGSVTDVGGPEVAAPAPEETTTTTAPPAGAAGENEVGFVPGPSPAGTACE